MWVHISFSIFFRINFYMMYIPVVDLEPCLKLPIQVRYGEQGQLTWGELSRVQVSNSISNDVYQRSFRSPSVEFIGCILRGILIITFGARWCGEQSFCS